jgi:hypothetical protein
MENKYYTPELSEFHVGFECEFLNSETDKLWTFNVCDVDLLSIAYDSYEHEDYEGEFSNTFRVKYLDRSDIESLGWENSYGDHYVMRSVDDDIDYDIFILDDRGGVWEYVIRSHKNPDEYGDSGEQLFFGTIKNKTELSKLMKQLGIWKD